MLNIEIHGNGRDHAHGPLHNKIRKLFEGAKCLDEIVVTSVGDEVFDISTGQRRQFLRVFISGDDSVFVFYQDSLTRLAALNMDTEIIVVSKFIQKIPRFIQEE